MWLPRERFFLLLQVISTWKEDFRKLPILLFPQSNLCLGSSINITLSNVILLMLGPFISVTHVYLILFLRYSAFFNRPVTITPIYANTTCHSPEKSRRTSLSKSSSLSSSPLSYPPINATKVSAYPSPSAPTTQKRQVHLVCSGRTVCVATSNVCITSSECARLFLDEGYAIGQLFRKLGRVPRFELLDAGLVDDQENNGGVQGELVTGRDEISEEKASLLRKRRARRKMWRRYTLSIDGFIADIVEVFPDRDMFIRGEEWLAEPQFLTLPSLSISIPQPGCISVMPTPGISLSPTETLVPSDDLFQNSDAESDVCHDTVVVSAPQITERDSWSESGGLLRFMAVFIAIILLLNMNREGDRSSSGGVNVGLQAVSSLLGRVAKLLDVSGYRED